MHRLKRESPESVFVFVSERGQPFATGGFAKMLTRLGQQLGWNWAPHPHMLRHATGFKLANVTHTLQHYLGHKNIRHTVVHRAVAS